MTKIAPSHYESTINGHAIQVFKGEGQRTWQLVVNRVWWNDFWTKADAMSAIEDAKRAGDLA